MHVLRRTTVHVMEQRARDYARDKWEYGISEPEDAIKAFMEYLRKHGVKLLWESK